VNGYSNCSILENAKKNNSSFYDNYDSYSDDTDYEFDDYLSESENEFEGDKYLYLECNLDNKIIDRSGNQSVLKCLGKNNNHEEEKFKKSLNAQNNFSDNQLETTIHLHY
jgi:hypothetical protein